MFVCQTTNSAIDWSIEDAQLQRLLEGYTDEFWASAGRDPREDIHAYLQYPAMMVPSIQRELIKVMRSVRPGIRSVVDPFVGAGTTMTSCMSLGLSFSGQDINPLAVLVARAKMGPFDNELLQNRLTEVLTAIRSDRSDAIETGFTNVNKWFQPNVQVDLSRIRRQIRSERQLWIRRFLWVALAETVRLTSNSRTSTYKLHIRRSEELQTRKSSAIDVFDSVTRRNLVDLQVFSAAIARAGFLRDHCYTGGLAIHLQDTAKEVHPLDGDGSQYDLVVTSPPYGDSTSTVAYGQFAYLPLQWIDLDDIDDQLSAAQWLCTTAEVDRRCLGGRIPRDIESQAAYLRSRSVSYNHTVQQLTIQPGDRARRITSFCYDLDKALSSIVASLKPNGFLIWIIGNRHVGGIEIPTDAILTELLAQQKVAPVTRVTRQILFRRMATRNKIASMMRQEHILLFRNMNV